MIKNEEQAVDQAATRLIVVHNWSDELGRVVPVH